MEAYKICPQCGTHNDPQSGLCTKCQKTLVDVPVSGDLSKVKPGKNPVAQILKVCAVVIYLFAAVTGLIEASNSGGMYVLLRDCAIGFMAGPRRPMRYWKCHRKSCGAMWASPPTNRPPIERRRAG